MRWLRITTGSTDVYVKQGLTDMINSNSVWTASFPMQW